MRIASASASALRRRGRRNSSTHHKSLATRRGGVGRRRRQAGRRPSWMIHQRSTNHGDRRKRTEAANFSWTTSTECTSTPATTKATPKRLMLFSIYQHPGARRRGAVYRSCRQLLKLSDMKSSGRGLYRDRKRSRHTLCHNHLDHITLLRRRKSFVAHQQDLPPGDQALTQHPLGVRIQTVPILSRLSHPSLVNRHSSTIIPHLRNLSNVNL